MRGRGTAGSSSASTAFSRLIRTGFGSSVKERQDDLKWCGSSPLYTFPSCCARRKGSPSRLRAWNIDDSSVVSFAALSFTDSVTERPPSSIRDECALRDRGVPTSTRILWKPPSVLLLGLYVIMYWLWISRPMFCAARSRSDCDTKGSSLAARVLRVNLDRILARRPHFHATEYLRK